MSEKIADHIMRLARWEGSNKTGASVLYRSACECMAPEHDLWIDLNFDKELNMLTMSFNYELSVNESYNEGLLGHIKIAFKRILKAVRLLFTGRIVCNEEFIFHGDDHIDAFIQALDEGRQYINSNMEKH